MTDTIKTIGTYLTAYSLVVGGLLIIYLTRSDPAAQEIRLLMAGFVGAATTFLFSERAVSSAMSHQPNVTLTSGPPPSATVGDDQPPRPVVGGDAP